MQFHAHPGSIPRPLRGKSALASYNVHIKHQNTGRPGRGATHEGFSVFSAVSTGTPGESANNTMTALSENSSEEDDSASELFNTNENDLQSVAELYESPVGDAYVTARPGTRTTKGENPSAVFFTRISLCKPEKCFFWNRRWIVGGYDRRDRLWWIESKFHGMG